MSSHMGRVSVTGILGVDAVTVYAAVTNFRHRCRPAFGQCTRTLVVWDVITSYRMLRYPTPLHLMFVARIHLISSFLDMYLPNIATIHWLHLGTAVQPAPCSIQPGITAPNRGISSLIPYHDQSSPAGNGGHYRLR